MLLQGIILLISFVVLIKGADVFVESASSVAKHLNVPDILIGLTIVAFGTSAPEAAVSIKAVLAHNSDIVLGNIVGSNILNILLILGISSMIAPIHVQSHTIKKEIPFLLLVSLLLSILLMDTTSGEGTVNMISRMDGIVILLFFAVFIEHLISLAQSGQAEEIESKYTFKQAILYTILGLLAIIVGGLLFFAVFIEHLISLAQSGQAEEIESKYTFKQAILYTILGLLAIIVGGNFVVSSATAIATALGVSQKFIALTIVALGTSLPELVTSIAAAQKGKQDLAIGNVIGSNIFNICFVAGFPAAFIGNIIPSSPVIIDLMIMLLATLMLFFFSYTKKKITKLEGISFLLIFVVYYGYLIISQIKS